MNKKNIIRIVLCALFIALTIIFTALIYFPIGTQGGYINIGDSIIIVSSYMLGPLYGAFVGAFGSMIADLIVAPQYALFTFIIKGVEGFIIGFLIKKNYKKTNVLLASFLGLLIMVIGYYFVGVFMYESFIAPITDTLFNLIQMIVCLILSQAIIRTISIYKIKRN